ncbi:hypothetical protein [Comamonas kerstersii]|uniref:hypothetical protein n=1 Tax=Comamonas kerstersii TaxID=225992 RepID=UPI00266D1088|nr:hypothetical protein [Comamonas kerstersii]
MARIELKQPGQPVADFAVDGAQITIAGVLVDCEALQQDTTEIVEVRQSSAGVHIGGDGAYLAQIEIPARTYANAAAASGEGDDQAQSESLAHPLDANAILVTLWPAA